MSDDGLDVYLNDHQAGATFGRDLARQIHERTEGTPLGRLVGSLKTVTDDYPALDGAELDRLIERAAARRGILERERMAAGREALRPDGARP